MIMWDLCKTPALDIHANDIVGMDSPQVISEYVENKFKLDNQNATNDWRA